ncbi:LamG-like jellyroll fold domain-containing protein [Bacteroidota bacterium]
MRLKRIALFFSLLMTSILVVAQDTIVVQTFVFDSITKRRGMFEFPEGESFRKILMYQTLKCDPRTTHDKYDCGEWDYLTYNTVYEHTGVYDSTLYHQPIFTYINDVAVDSLLERSTPAYTYFNKLHRSTTYGDTLSLNEALLGSGTQVSAGILNAQQHDGRSQFLWRNDELTAAGLSAGYITGMKLRVESPGTDIRHLVIRMKQVSIDAITPDTLFSGFQQVYYNGYQMPDTGWVNFPFYAPFEWDGLSNLLIDISFEQSETGTATTLYADDPGFDCGISTTGPNWAIDFDGEMDFVKVPADVYFQGNFTFETWFLKRNNNTWSRVFDFGNGPNASNFIVTFSQNNTGKLSVHVNNSNGISRNIATPEPLPLNEWIHVAITMTMDRIAWMYVNGEFILVAPLQDPDSVVRTVNYLGKSNWSTDKYADALIDELRIYEGSREADQIRNDMRHSITDPQNEPNLLLYYTFNEGAGINVTDYSSHAHHGTCYGLPSWQRVPGPSLHGDFVQENLRPQLLLEQLESTSLVVDTLIVTDSLANAPVQIVLYENTQDPTIPTDTLAIYRAGNSYVYQEGNVVDTVWFDYETIRYKEMIPYYGEPFEILEPYEIGRYITPYGIGLSLGQNGFTWIYDVTDYAPFLQGMVDISAGNQQELIDLKFVMIKGTPPRDVVRMDRIWGKRRSYLYKDLAADTVLKPVAINLDNSASQFRVRARLTGHGHNSNTGNYPHCCEWKDNTHYLFVNGEQVSAWHIFQYHDCGLNPVYPQGGTWPGAREGWCPGDLVKVHDVELTGTFPNNSVTIDYGITPVPTNNLGMGNGNYVVDMMLFQYGDSHFNNDAEAYDVIMPTIYEYYSRVNPTCSDPTVIFRNNGIAPLTSLTFNYGVSGGEEQSFTWEGELPPNQTDTVVLPVPGGFFWFGDTLKQFQVCLSDPNGLTDEYPDNNCYTTQYVMPDMYDETIVLKLKTNKQPWRYTLTVTDIAGNDLLTLADLAKDSTYIDTLNIPNGCYTITLIDDEDMGLSYWAYPEQGSGSFKLYDLDDNLVKYFKPEFGRMIKYSFLQGDISYIAEPNLQQQLLVYPNPADDKIHVRCETWSGKLTLRLINMKGEEMLVKEVDNRGLEEVTLSVNGMKPGLYLIVVTDELRNQTEKIIIQ